MQAEAHEQEGASFLTKGEVEKVTATTHAGQRQPRLGELVPQGGAAV